MSDEDSCLGEDVDEAIAQVFYDYKIRLQEILKPFSNEELLNYSGFVSPEKIQESFDARHLVPRMVAQTEVGYRQSAAKAEEAMNADPSIKVFCVFHDQDARKCNEEDH